MSYVKHNEDTRIPGWLRDNLHSHCKYCGKEMLNYYNDDNGRCTSRTCSNDLCYGKMAAKANFISDMLKIKGVGFATFLNNAKANSFDHHIDLFAYTCGRVKMNLSTYLRAMCFQGVDGEFKKICELYDIHTIDELYSKYNGELSKLLLDNKPIIEGKVTLVDLDIPENNKKIHECKRTFTIMITGNVNNFPTKEAFVTAINHSTNGLIKVIHQETKRQSGVDYLIKEEGTATKGKVAAAIKGGIPIVTSEQFIDIIMLTALKLQNGDTISN